jgi:hypothetical protein
MNMCEIFLPEPEQYGLRGDMEIWNNFSLLDLTGDDIYEQLWKRFENIVGDTSLEEKYVPELRNGGMSEGMVSIIWWNEVGFPLLQKRIEEYKNKTNGA